MAAPKCRIDVWQPTIGNVTTAGVTTTAQRPAAWVKCDTVTDVTTENPPGPNPNLRRANACTSVEIKDEMFSPRIAHISIANRPQDFTAFDDNTMETQHLDSDGNEIQINSSDVKTRIRRNWGPFSYFFREFQQIRIVDLETHMVLFTGRVYKVSKKHDGQRGATVELVCKDALEELKNFSMKTMPKELHFPANTYRSTVIQSLLNLALNYEGSLPTGGASKNQTSPVTTPLSTGNMASNDSNTSTTAGSSGDTANSYSRFERSMTKPSHTTKLKTRKTGSKNILTELTRWAILEPHENETAENQFGYDFFVDSNIGSTNLLATTAPPPSMFNYFKRGNRLSAAGSAGQDANTYGLTCVLPTVARAAHTGLQQANVGTTAESGNTTVESFDVNANHSLYPGQIITIGSEQMYVKFVANANEGLGNEEVFVVRGWVGSTPASFSSSAAIVENRPATAVMQKDTSSFDDAKDELFTECDLTYETSYVTGGNKLGTKEKTKKFEIMFVSALTGNFTWSGLDFDDEGKSSDDDDPGLDSAEWVNAYRANGTTLYANSVGRIQYQSTTSISGANNFAYLMLSDVSLLPATNYTSDGGSTYEDFIVLKGATSNVTCNLNLNSTDVQTGRPSTAYAEGTTRFTRGFTMTKETHENIDDIRQEVAARLGQSTIALKRGDFTVSKAPYYWADFKVRSVSADGSTGQILTVKSENGTAAVKVTNYGFREGMLTHKRADASNNPDYGYIATANGNDVYGYCYSMTADDTFRVNLTESQSFAVDDKIRLFIPVRAGEPMFVDHILATVYGEHLVTAVNFNEMPAPTTSYSTIGENETRMRMRVGSIRKQNIWNSIAVDKLEASERERPNLPKGTQTFSFSGTWSYPANNIVQWTAGDLRTADGEVYQIAASNTSDTTYGLGASGMTGSNDYTVYVDPEGENSSGNIYHLYTVISTSYLEDDDNIVVLKTSVGSISGKSNAVAGPNMDASQTATLKSDASKFVHEGSITTGLIDAEAITADKIAAGTITTNQLNFTYASEINSNGGLNSDTTASIQAVAAATSGTIAGLQVNASSLFMGTGHLGQTNTPFFVRGVNGTDGATYAAGTASQSGTTVTGSSTTWLGSGASSLIGRTFTFSSGGGGGTISAVTDTTHLTVSTSATVSSGTYSITGHAGTAGDFSLGNKFVWDESAGTLSVTGAITATSGTWTSDIAVGADNAIFKADSNGIYLGNASYSSAGFHVSMNGTLTLRDVNTSGAGTAATHLKFISNSVTAWNLGSYNYGTGREAGFIFMNGGGTASTQAPLIFIGGAGSDYAAFRPGTNEWLGTSLQAWGRVFTETLTLEELGSVPADIGASHAQLFVKSSDGNLYFKKNGETEVEVGSGSGVALGDTPIWTGRHRWSYSSTSQAAIWSSASPGQFDYGMWLKDEASVPGSPTSGYIRLYSESSVLKYKNSSGTVSILTGEGDSPTWTGNHNFNGNVYMNGGTIHIGNAAADIVTIDAKIYGGGFAAPGLRWDDGVLGVAGMYFEDSGGYSRTKFVGRGQTANHGYFSSDGTYSYVWASSVTGNYTYANTAFRAPDGSAGATSYSFSGATNSGLFRSSGNYIGIAYGGGVKLEAQANYVVLNQKLRLLDIASSTGTALMIDGSGDVVQSSSTQRAKMNIRDLEFDSAPIYDINLKSFEMRNQYDDGNGKLQWGDEAQETSFGMIAEEVHLLLPQLVSLDNEGLPISINYPLLSVLLVGELKKLRARIEILEGN